MNECLKSNKLEASRPSAPARFQHGFGRWKTNRIAMVSTHGYVASKPELGAADTGGQVVFVLELSGKLADLGYKVDIWTRRFQDQPEQEVICDKVRIIRIPCGGTEFIAKEFLYEHMEEWAKNALRWIQREVIGYDFINSHYWDAGVGARALASALKVPHLHTPHSLGIWKMRQMQGDFPESVGDLDSIYNFTVRNRMERKLYQECNAVAATTPLQTDMLKDDYHVPLDKLKMVSAGYDEKRFHPVDTKDREALRKKFGFKGKAVLALGRIARNKGYDLLIRSFPRVLERVPDAHLYLAVGAETISERERCVLEECRQAAAESGVEQAVSFHGYVPDQELADIYRAADLFVLCSRYEPFGMTAIEAMACGTPVVSTIHGGLWRALRYGIDGLYADPFDADDLAVTVSKALLYPGLASRLSEMGAERALSSFTWTSVAKQLMEAVRNLPATVPALTKEIPALC